MEGGENTVPWPHIGAIQAQVLKFLGNKFDENNLKGILLYSMKIDRLSSGRKSQ
jgi:hypothetical protein